MATVTDVGISEWTFADALAHFGPMPLTRVRLHPRPGTATVDDVVRIHNAERKLCELVDGVLLEKTIGADESMFAFRLGLIVGMFVKQHRLGVMLGEAGMMELCRGLVRIPDLSFISHARFANTDRTRGAWPVAPDLAVEVLSRSNTTKEMERKISDYFAADVREVWYADPEKRTLDVFYSLIERRTFVEPDLFRDSRVLPGLEFSMTELFTDESP